VTRSLQRLYDDSVYEVFEHTADIGLRIVAPDVSGLFAEAGRGLFSVIAGDLEQIREIDTESFTIPGADRTYLLFDWLTELLYAFESKRSLFRRFEVRVDQAGATATAHGERFDPLRHRLQHEVKAITYHELVVKETPRGLEATLILDI
jgi:SHS2 domain-containing protein